MAKKALTAIGTMTAIADLGYFKGEEILACHEVGITALVPKTKTSNAKADVILTGRKTNIAAQLANR